MYINIYSMHIYIYECVCVCVCVWYFKSSLYLQTNIHQIVFKYILRYTHTHWRSTNMQTTQKTKARIHLISWKGLHSTCTLTDTFLDLCSQISAAQIPHVSPQRNGNTLSNSLKHTSDLSEERFENTPDGSVESLFSLSESLKRKGMPSNAFAGTTVIFLLLRSRRPAWVGHEPARTSGPPFMLPEKEQPPNVTDHSGAALPPTSIDLHRDKVWVCQCQMHTSTHAVPLSF